MLNDPTRAELADRLLASVTRAGSVSTAPAVCRALLCQLAQDTIKQIPRSPKACFQERASPRRVAHRDAVNGFQFQADDAMRISVGGGLEPAPRQGRSGVAGVLSGSGALASLVLMACCSLPLLLASVGLAGAWTLALQTALGPHEQLLLWLSVSSLGLGAAAWVWQVWRAHTSCELRRRLGGLALSPILLLLGAGLTWLALHPG